MTLDAQTIQALAAEIVRQIRAAEQLIDDAEYGALDTAKLKRERKERYDKMKLQRGKK